MSQSFTAQSSTSQSSTSQSSGRSAEAMMAELVHHMAEMVKTQAETNRLLKDLLVRLER
ncbi:hypothetical protein VQH23_00910 [Pararoseomonas sp. SCSIO 73927]|uniref:hypothetical protein n=1 Tax=Pararoseomonas sp. SCSIO 73927 TaxID=3114537 RepID=UPI0030CB6996